MTPQTPQAIFNAAYIASKDPAVQALFDMGNAGNPPGQRASAAYGLAKKGYTIDAVIDAYGQDPYNIMEQRVEVLKDIWTPSALMQDPDDRTALQRLPIPPGAIINSDSLKDYPPFVTAPPAPPTDSVVGNYMGCTSDEIAPPVNPPVKVFISAAMQHYPEGTLHTMTAAGGSGLLKAGDILSYHILGSDLMDYSERVGVWLGPLASA